MLIHFSIDGDAQVKIKFQPMDTSMYSKNKKVCEKIVKISMKKLCYKSSKSKER